MPDRAAKPRSMPGTHKSFRREAGLSMPTIVRELYRANSAQFQVQNETVAVKNLLRIIDATLNLANKKGFAAMSLRDLAAATGMSLGGLYAYIRSKDDLVTLIQSQGRKLVAQTLSAALAAHSQPAEQLQASIRAHLFLSESLRAWFFFSYMEARHLPPEQRRLAVASELQTEALYHDIISAGQTAGVFRGTDASMASAQLKALLQDWYLKRKKYRSRGISVEQYADAVIDLMNRLLMEART